jgi:endonuclease YncB( thermonuclease family)
MYLLFAALLFAFGCIAQAATIDGKVINVADGDTITILDAANQHHRIRINGIDAPEKGQPFGDRSRQSMATMVAGKEVTADCHKTDRYKRQVCKVWVQPSDCASCGKTLDVGHAQIIGGMAWWYREYAKEQTPEDRGRYESAEVEAKARKFGLWGDTSSTAPWEWRKKPK